ncbi:GlxA family transcriptional regulator [Dinghuibacter silviterrae]|uniref:AraC family transcriptional regulator with amidase-like domain n=1 Tax=Dinghuibacter silviterrae TaxID=1539049 RepID=A0A4R8DF90_9BACT|nr:helix-turn-helix domain-containing protein [Dinghuibacter silviterrae]TDW95746.1 AraC family transcriptional regulator with amidase-like domain [Dinghuibacter silviterrae]
MKEIALLIHKDVVLSTISGTLDMLEHTNRYLEASGKPRAFSVTLVGESASNDLLPVAAPYIHYCRYTDLASADLIIVPAFFGQPDDVFAGHRSLLDWLRRMHDEGNEIASLCSGAYFLAEAGLLEGRCCTAHWRDIEDLKRRYPDTRFLSRMVMTDQDGLYTSGGAFSAFHLVLYLIEKYCGRDMGIWASKMFSLDMDRESQAYFAVFQGQFRHQDEQILTAQEYIDKNYNEPLSVEQMALQINMSLRNFIRRFKTATQNTPLEYLQRVRIEAAKKALEAGNPTITSLMYDSGYQDIKTFRKVFKRITGLTPIEYRKKYSRTLPVLN